MLKFITALFFVVLVLVVASTFTNANQQKQTRGLRDPPTGGSITVSPSYWFKATQHLKSLFDISVKDSFTVTGMQSTPLTSLPSCFITYADVKLAAFSETNITYRAIPTNSSQTAIHEITIHEPSFTLQTFPYTAVCPFGSSVGLLNTQATGNIQGTFSADSIVVQVTQTISAPTSGNAGAVVASTARIQTTVGMQLSYNYNPIAGVSQQGFIFDEFWKHHVSVTLQDQVNRNIESLFNASGIPISKLVNNMNSLFSQWPDVCSIDQHTEPGALIINTYPQCQTQSISGLPALDFRVVQVSNSSSSSSELSSSSASACTPQSGNCWNPSPYPGDGSIFITYNNCLQCIIGQGNSTGTAGVVKFQS